LGLTVIDELPEMIGWVKSLSALAILMHVQKKPVAASVLEQAWREAKEQD
jgi:hypothetical protein